VPIVLKNSKIAFSKNPANVAHWGFLPLQGSVELIRAPAIVFAVIDVALTSQRERRTSGPKNFHSSAKKDFFNAIEGTTDVPCKRGRFRF
jgi:hypothetical protein